MWRETFTGPSVWVEFVADLAVAAIAANRVDADVLTAVVLRLTFIVLCRPSHATHKFLRNPPEFFQNGAVNSNFGEKMLTGFSIGHSLFHNGKEYSLGTENPDANH